MNKIRNIWNYFREPYPRWASESLRLHDRPTFGDHLRHCRDMLACLALVAIIVIPLAMACDFALAKMGSETGDVQPTPAAVADGASGDARDANAAGILPVLAPDSNGAAEADSSVAGLEGDLFSCATEVIGGSNLDGAMLLALGRYHHLTEGEQAIVQMRVRFHNPNAADACADWYGDD